MTVITTSYTSKAQENTLCGAPLSKYRLTNWLLDILKNFMRDPINLRDERICDLLRIQDKPGADWCDSLFVVDIPYNTDIRKAANTPLIMVAAGESSYPIDFLNNGLNVRTSGIEGSHAYQRTMPRVINATIGVLTESCAGTMLLSDIIEDFLIRTSLDLASDGMVQKIRVTGCSDIKHIGVTEALNAKDLYQIVIGLTAAGALTWINDTQGPVYRGTSLYKN